MLWLKSLYLSSHKNTIHMIKNDKLYFLRLIYFHVVGTCFVLLRPE